LYFPCPFVIFAVICNRCDQISSTACSPIEFCPSCMLQKLLLSACVEHIFEARHINTTTTFVGCETFTFVQKASSQAIQARLLAWITTLNYYYYYYYYYCYYYNSNSLSRYCRSFEEASRDLPLRVDGVGFPVELVARACRCPQAAVSGDLVGRITVCERLLLLDRFDGSPALGQCDPSRFVSIQMLYIQLIQPVTFSIFLEDVHQISRHD
ncbi:hypothetical protein T4D_1731, partial [Trichinella pseudospiralis]